MPPTVAWLTTDFSPGLRPLQPGGCAWYRQFLPMRELQAAGWTTGMGIPEYRVEKGFGILVDQARAVHGWDVVVLKLLMNRDTPHQVVQAKAAGQLVVVDVDDFYAGLTPDNQAHAATDPSRVPERNRDHYEKVIAAADVVVTSTPFLHAWYSERHPDVRMVRNGIDPARWGRHRDQAGTRPTLGWVGGIPWRSGDLETLRPWLPGFVAEHGLRVHHSGHVQKGQPFHVKTGVPADVMTVAGMRPIVDYPTLFHGFQVGLVPLSDIPFNHAKSSIKGLEYAAAGIPFVAAATPEYRLLAEQGVGRVASTPDEWVQHLTELLDPRLRKREAARNRAAITQAHTMRDRGIEWAALLGSVTGNGR